MDVADEIAHCALMIDQARDLIERGDRDAARERLETAHEHAERAKSSTDERHSRQVQECIDASEALLKRLDG